jgi:hypothetical protein
VTGFTDDVIQYNKWDSVDISFTPIVLSVDGCPVTYYLVDDQANETVETQKFEHSTTVANGGKLTGTIE